MCRFDPLPSFDIPLCVVAVCNMQFILHSLLKTEVKKKDTNNNKNPRNLFTIDRFWCGDQPGEQRRNEKKKNSLKLLTRQFHVI